MHTYCLEQAVFKARFEATVGWTSVLCIARGFMIKIVHICKLELVHPPGSEALYMAVYMRNRLKKNNNNKNKKK